MSKRKGSPLVKSVLVSKKKVFPVANNDSNLEWSTVEHSTVDLLRQDWSEEDSETDGEYLMEGTNNKVIYNSPEQLREAEVPHFPSYCPPAGPLVAFHMVSGPNKAQLARSPAVQSLSDLLNIKSGKFQLLPNSSDSSSSYESNDEFTMSLSNRSKMGGMLTSTMVNGGKDKEEDLVAENISVINTRVSLDPRLSVEPCKTGFLKRQPDREQLICGASEDSSFKSSRSARVLSSTPARIGVPGYSLELSSIHSSDAGGSMLVPRVVREMITEEMVEEEASLEGDTWYLNEEREETIKDSVDKGKEKEISMNPPQSTGPTTILLSDSVAVSPSATHPPLCQYPPPPHNSAVPISLADYLTLNRGTYINDVIIDFYLTYLYLEVLPQKEKDKVWIFSSFFYKRLCSDPVKGSMMDIMESRDKLSVVMTRHKRVETWTKGTDLTSKKLIIFPICKDSHWFLVTAVLGVDDMILVVMDSLGGENKEVSDNIKEYLAIELNKKMDEKLLMVKVVHPTLPQQENLTDCGVFLLHYVEEMFKGPGQIEKLEFKDWFSTSKVNTKRSILAKLIRKMIEDQELPGVVPVLPDLVGEEISEDNTSEQDISSVFDMKRNIEAELSQLSPDNSARCRSSRSALSSEDTSGEIFSAVIHRTQTAMVIKYLTMAAGCSSARGPGSRKKFKLASGSRKATQLRIFTKGEYYKGMPGSERKFDELLEEEDDDDDKALFAK